MRLILENTCELINGGAWSDQEYTESGIPVVKVTNMVDGSVSTENLSYLPISSYEKYKKHQLRLMRDKKALNAKLCIIATNNNIIIIVGH